MVYNDTLPPMIVLPQPIVCMSPIGRDTFSFLSRSSVVWVPNQLSSELEIEWRLTVNVKCAQQIIFVTSMQAYTNILRFYQYNINAFQRIIGHEWTPYALVLFISYPTARLVQAFSRILSHKMLVVSYHFVKLLSGRSVPPPRTSCKEEDFSSLKLEYLEKAYGLAYLGNDLELKSVHEHVYFTMILQKQRATR